ncbi:MAG: hypothetical protein JXA71_01670 [Chitinispirillaceae bacterium]|nr:hypothetical protein [Chitinispirillaceae bacterium]
MKAKNQNLFFSRYTLPCLTNNKTTVGAVHLTGIIIDKSGNIVRSGIEGIMVDHPDVIGSWFGNSHADYDYALIEKAIKLRRDDLSGKPLQWKVAIRHLVIRLQKNEPYVLPATHVQGDFMIKAGMVMVLLSLYSVMVFSESAQQDTSSSWESWIQVSSGYTHGANGLDNTWDPFGASLSINYSKKYDFHYISLRGDYSQEIAVFGNSDEHLYNLGIMYGWCATPILAGASGEVFKLRAGVSFSLGLGLQGGIEHIELIDEIGFERNYQNESFLTIGIPAQIDCFLLFSEKIGAGASGFLNGNSTRSWAGVWAGLRISLDR